MTDERPSTEAATVVAPGTAAERVFDLAAERSAGQIRQDEQDRIRRHRRWVVHVLLVLAVSGLGLTVAGVRAARGVRDALDTRLIDAGAGVNSEMVSVEAEQLSLARSIAFTQGVDAALVRGDVPALDSLVTPLQANAQPPMVDLVLPDGQVQFAVRAAGAPAPVSSRAGLPALAQSLSAARAGQGGRFTQLQLFSQGPVVMTIAPVGGASPVGAVLVMTPLADVLGRSAQVTRTNLTAYNGDGAPLATTAPFNPAPMPSALATQLGQQNIPRFRYDHPLQREAVDQLIIDHTPQAFLGVSLLDRSGVTGRAVAFYMGLALFVVATVLVLLVRALGRRPEPVDTDVIELAP